MSVQKNSSSPPSRFAEPPEAGSVRLADMSAQKRLLTAIRQADVKAIRGAIRDGAEVNYWSFGDGASQPTLAFPLSVALDKRDRKMIKLLLELGAAVNFEDGVYFAVRRADLPLLKLLLKHGASPDGMRYWKPDWNDKSGNDTSLTLAAAAGRHTIVKALLEAGANAEHENDEGASALLIALRAGDKRMVKLVAPFVSAQHKARMESLCGEEHEAAVKLDDQISEAIKRGQAKELRRLIVENKRDVNEYLLNCDGSLLQLAVLHYNEQLYREENPGRDDEPCLSTPAQMLEVIKALLDLNAPVDAMHYETPLHMGALLCRDHPDLYEEMLSRAETVDVVTAVRNATPLMDAAGWGKVAAVKLLLQYGADPNRKDEANLSALGVVRRQQKHDPDNKDLKKVAQILIDAGAKE